MKISVALIASGLSTKTGMRGSSPSVIMRLRLIDQFLRAADRESGHDHVPAALDGALDHIAEFNIGLFRFAVRFIAVGAFHQKISTSFGMTGSSSSGRRSRPISPENHSRVFLPFSSISSTTAADPRICPASTKRAVTPLTGSKGSLYLFAHEQIRHFFRVFDRIQRFNCGLAVFAFLLGYVIWRFPRRYARNRAA